MRYVVDFVRLQYIKPESVREILDEEDKDNFLAKILTCGIIIYDISNTLSCHPVQIEEATWVINSKDLLFKERRDQLKKDSKRIIFITDTSHSSVISYIYTDFL